MAFTKLYLTNTTAPYTPATLRGVWDVTSGAVTKALSPLPNLGGVTTYVSKAETSADTSYDALLYRGVSCPLAAQTINCNVNTVIGLRESNAAADLTGGRAQQQCQRWGVTVNTDEALLAVCCSPPAVWPSS